MTESLKWTCWDFQKVLDQVKTRRNVAFYQAPTVWPEYALPLPTLNIFLLCDQKCPLPLPTLNIFQQSIYRGGLWNLSVLDWLGSS